MRLLVFSCAIICLRVITTSRPVSKVSLARTSLLVGIHSHDFLIPFNKFGLLNDRTLGASAAFGSAIQNAAVVGNGRDMGVLIGVHTGPAMAEQPTSTTEMRFCNRKCKEMRPISEFRKPSHKGCRDCLDYDKGCKERGKAKRRANIPVAIHPRTPGDSLAAQIADAILAIDKDEPIMLRELAAQQTSEAETVSFEGSLPHQYLYEAFPDRPIGYYFDIWKYMVLRYLGHR
jgi:hypothetical protein